jgi:Uma2 family endonuclease
LEPGRKAWFSFGVPPSGDRLYVTRRNRQTASCIGSKAVASAPPRPWTVDDFLAWEAQQPERYEFIDGMVFMMVGGSAAHTIIKGNVFKALSSRLSGGQCQALTEGLKVVTPENVHYPDTLVI